MSKIEITKKRNARCVDEEYAIRKWMSLKQSADNRKLEFDLTLLSVKNLLSARKCFYTGVEFNPKVKGLGFSVDRVDPSKGYVRGNVVACTEGYNIAKSEWEKLGKGGVGKMITNLKKIYDKM